MSYKTPNEQDISYFILAIYSFLLSIIAYVVLFLPLSWIDYLSDEVSGGFFLIAFLSVFVPFLNVLFICVIRRKVRTILIKELFLKMVVVFVPLIYVSNLVMRWLEFMDEMSLLAYAKDVYTNSEALYILFTALLGIVLYYLVFSMLVVKFYFLIDKRSANAKNA